jgi:hypothetical protein
MACISKAWFSSNFHQARIISLTVFIFLFSPVILLVIFLLQLYRKCVSVCARILQSDLGSIISPRSAILACDDLYGIPSHNKVSWFVLKGKMSIDSLQSTIYEKVLNKTDSGGNYVYPTLRQFPVPFHKFLFWKWDADFKIESHIYIHEKAKDDNKHWSEEDILDVQNKLLRKQWTRHRSPWEIFLIPNFKPSGSFRETKTVMFLRFHECLGDPSSWFEMFILDLCDCDNANGHHLPRFAKQISSAQVESNLHITPMGTKHLNGIDRHRRETNCEEFSKKHFLKTIKQLAYEFILPIRIPYDFASQAMEARDENAWNVEDAKLIKRDHLKLIDQFSVRHVKDIKNVLGVSFTSVLLAVSTQALRAAFKELGLIIPRYMKISMPLVHDCHCNDKLGNYL